MQLICFLMLVAVINLVGNTWFPMRLGDKDLRWKIDEVTNGNYDCIFIGSSRVYRNIDPLTFDSTALTKSYNFGARNTFVPEVYYVSELLLRELRNKDHNVKSIILEVQNLDFINPSSALTLKGNYFMDSYNLILANRILWDSHLIRSKKIAGSVSFLLAFTANYFGFNYLSTWSPPKSLTRHVEVRGHLCINDQISLGIEREALLKRHEYLLKNPSVMDERSADWLRMDSLRNIGDLVVNPAHMTKLNELIRQSGSQGVQLLFVLPPLLADYSELIPLVDQLGESRCVNLSSPIQFPEFWTIDNAFDKGHLNCQGVRLYSTVLANEYINRTSGQLEEDTDPNAE